ncbi:MAG: thrombospondin type 3 repeat-containing protein [Gammaproteobacteria bacterium]|nr:thrombospondin type 3 repeat-containing protein [Gammaproteobacteria bacterium]
MHPKTIAALMFSSLAIAQPATAGINVEETDNAQTLVQHLLGSNIAVSNVSLTAASNSAGIFSGGEFIVGFDGGIVLSSGRSAYVVGPNISDSKTQINYKLGDEDLDTLIPGYSTHDATILEFDFVPNNGVISFQYVFSSEEYNEWVNSSFNDVFGFFLNGKNIATLPGSDMTVSINNVNRGNPYGYNMSNPQYFINNDLTDAGGDINTEMDGMTVVLSVQAVVTPGVSHHLKLAIGDAGDSILDSNVFIKAGSFIDAISDMDGDGIADGVDNCLHTSNPMQEDYDNDGVGYLCDETPAPMPLNFAKMTGGGAVASGRGNFGFNIINTATGINVHLQYNRKNRGKASKTDSPLQIKMKGNIDQLSAVKNASGVEFTAPCTVRTLLNGSDRVANICRVRVIDNGKGGKSAADEFTLEIIDGPSKGYHSGTAQLVHGNITAHKE